MKKSFNKLFAVLLSLILLIGALYIPLGVFAEEENGTLTFKDYPYSQESLVFGKVMSIANEKGIGVDDDYALKLNYNSKDVYKVDADGKEILMSSRYNLYEHSAIVSEGLEDGVTYRLTYDAKIVSSNVGVKITPLPATTKRKREHIPLTGMMSLRAAPLT